MEHSKLPWKVSDWGTGYITNIYMLNDEDVHDCTDGHICQVAHMNFTGKPSGAAGQEAHKQQVANAQFIVTACNEHYGLKAKAEMLDEMVKMIDSFEQQVKRNPQPCLLEFAWNKIIETLSKAKELK